MYLINESSVSFCARISDARAAAKACSGGRNDISDAVEAMVFSYWMKSLQRLCHQYEKKVKWHVARCLRLDNKSVNVNGGGAASAYQSVADGPKNPDSFPQV